MSINTAARSSQVREHILDFIHGNGLLDGEQLPSEAELASEIGVSRNTIREAYISLEAEGVIIRRHGVGTFVTGSRKVKEPIIDQLTSFAQTIKNAGHAFGFESISRGYVLPAREVAQAFQCEPGDNVFQIKTVLFADRIPAIYIIDHFSAQIDSTEFEWDKYEGDMLAFVSRATGMTERIIHSRVFAALAENEIADLLGLDVGRPIVNIHSSITSENDQHRTYSIIYVNPDKFEYEVKRVYRLSDEF